MTQPQHATFQRPQDTFEVKLLGPHHRLSPERIRQIGKALVANRHAMIANGHFLQQAVGGIDVAERVAHRIANPENPRHVYQQVKRLENMPLSNRLFYVTYCNRDHISGELSTGPAGHVWLDRQPDPETGQTVTDLDVVLKTSIHNRTTQQGLGNICTYAALNMVAEPNDAVALRIAYNNDPLRAELANYGYKHHCRVARPDLSLDVAATYFEDYLIAPRASEVVKAMVEANPWLNNGQFT